MRLVITGANSFIGRRLARRAVSAGWETVLVMRQGHSVPLLPCDCTVISLPMEEYEKLGDLAGACDCFVHLAWNGTRGGLRMDSALQRSNEEHSVQAVRSMLEAGCRRVITAGSQAEYGPHAGQISEDSDCLPNTEYGAAKLRFYRRAAELCGEKGAKLKEPRFFSLYGPGDYPETMVIGTLKKMLAGEACPLTQCVQNWDFLYVDDAVEGVLELCGADCADGVYNFGSGDVRQLKDYVQEMARLTGTKSELQFGAVPYPETGMVSLWPDVSKLKRELAWQPRVSFEEGVRAIIDDLTEEK